MKDEIAAAMLEQWRALGAQGEVDLLKVAPPLPSPFLPSPPLPLPIPIPIPTPLASPAFLPVLVGETKSAASGLRALLVCTVARSAVHTCTSRPRKPAKPLSCRPTPTLTSLHTHPHTPVLAGRVLDVLAGERSIFWEGDDVGASGCRAVCEQQLPAHICAGTGLHPAHICTETGLTPATSALGLGACRAAQIRRRVRCRG
jgi:hypothetical protein